MPINLNGQSKQLARQFAEAFASGDESRVEEAFQAFSAGVSEDIAEQFRAAQEQADRAALAQRGFRQLTSAEERYYDGVIEALCSEMPKQALVNFSKLPEGTMPETVIDEIVKDIQGTHPLLAAVNVTNTGYVTKWLRNKHTRQLAVWGKPGDAISKEITSAFDELDVRQGKLSCYALVSRDMLSLGATFLDGYVRTVIGEAIACGLEDGIVNGKGVNSQPVGLVCDIHEGASFSTSTGYTAKTAVKVTDFSAATYGALVAKLAKDESGKDKAIDFRQGGLGLVCSTTDYLTKVMPATTVQNVDGTYKNDLFPLPTEVYSSATVADGTAILFLPGEYDVFMGADRGIEVSDEVKFLEDQRAFKEVMYAYGRAYDNTSAIVLDISKLDPAYVTVKTKATVDGTVSTKASA